MYSALLLDQGCTLLYSLSTPTPSQLLRGYNPITRYKAPRVMNVQELSLCTALVLIYQAVQGNLVQGLSPSITEFMAGLEPANSCARIHRIDLYLFRE